MGGEGKNGSSRARHAARFFLVFDFDFDLAFDFDSDSGFEF